MTDAQNKPEGYDHVGKVLEILSTPDWISPLVALIQDFTNGPHTRFYVDPYCGYSCNGLMRELRKYGIQPWGQTYVVDYAMFIFTVKRAQAAYTLRILEQLGVAVYGTHPQIKPAQPEPKTLKGLFKDGWG